MRWPLRAQLLMPVLLLLAGVAAISFWTAWAATRQARRQLEDRQRDVARFLVEQSHFPLTEDVLRKLEPLSGAEYLLRPVAGPPRASLDLDPASVSDAPVADDWQALRLGSPVTISGRTYLCAGIRLRRGDHAGDILYILYPERLWRDARWEAIRPSLILGISAGLAALALAIELSRRLGRRLRELGRRTRRIAAGDFDPMPLPTPDDEIRDLAGAVNEMAQQLARLEKAIEQAERFRLLGQISGGLAHQLRNGLTGARLAVQLHLRENAGGDSSALQVALRQLTLLETHVKRFLDLGRTGPARREPCDLVALVNESVELLIPQCRHAGIDLTWQRPASPCAIDGDAGQLGQLVVNLLTNAIEAAGPGGKVSVGLQIADCRLQIGRPSQPEAPARESVSDTTRSASEGVFQSAICNLQSAILLEVEDTGPGPSASVAERLFEPFVTSKPEGVGLGLAVAKRVAEGHGGRLSWERREGRTCFRVELPLRTV